jgi:uncharacterized protein YecA (UPF0149 family)
MTNENKDQTGQEEEEVGHVHGPNCNHGHEQLRPITRASVKIGRNDPCSCGSKKKFKKCCGK